MVSLYFMYYNFVARVHQALAREPSNGSQNFRSRLVDRAHSGTVELTRDVPRKRSIVCSGNLANIGRLRIVWLPSLHQASAAYFNRCVPLD